MACACGRQQCRFGAADWCGAHGHRRGAVQHSALQPAWGEYSAVRCCAPPQVPAPVRRAPRPPHCAVSRGPHAERLKARPALTAVQYTAVIDCAQYAVCLAYLQQWIANPVARIRTAAQLPCSACRVRSAMRIIADQSAQATTLRFPCAHVCALSTAHCICRGITAVTDTCVVDLTAVLHIAALTLLRTESPIVAAALDCVESFQFGQFASCTSGTVPYRLH